MRKYYILLRIAMDKKSGGIRDNLFFPHMQLQFFKIIVRNLIEQVSRFRQMYDGR